MQIAVTSTGRNLDDRVEARFGRCPYFIIVDTDSMEFEAVENANVALGGGAGIQSAQLMSEKDVKAVLTGNCGPNAFNVFGQAGVKVIVGVSGTVRDAVEQFKSGKLSSAEGPNVGSHFGVNSNAQSEQEPGVGSSESAMYSGGMGMGLAGGRGRGMGGGRGMGRGRGMSMPGQGSGFGYPSGDSSQIRGEELEQLKKQAEALKQQKEDIDKKISELEGRRKAVAVVELEKCNGCGVCVNACPVNAITLNGHANINPELCTACAVCVRVCPQEAIMIRQERIEG